MSRRAVKTAMKHQISDLYQMQSLPLDIKIRMTENRIRDWYNHYGGDVYCSFSGGKDSTVLLDIIHRTLPCSDIPAVFVDTGLEYPEIKAFVKSVGDVTIVRPTMTFRQVIEKYGYPVISKEVARRVQYAKKAIAEGREDNHGDYLKLCGLAVDKSGQKSQYNCEKWKFLLDAPFGCSSECCTVMKKNPMKQYEKETGRVPIVATMASESRLRKEQWLIHGCNAFDAKRPRSQPMSFWTEQDVLQYIYTYKIPYAKEVYGDIYIDENGKYKTTGADRTGCVFCMFGCHLEKEPNRFQKLAETHPKLYSYCIGGGTDESGVWLPDNKGLGLGKVLDYIGVNYKKEEPQNGEILELDKE